MNAKRKASILIVEDDQDAREALCAMVESLGHAPLAFPGGKEALEGLEDQKVHIALIDIMMPEMNGFELLEKLKEIPHYARVPIIMVTARDQHDEILEGYQQGAEYYITKPYTLKQIDYALNLFLT